MKFTCETSAFTDAMQIASRVIPQKSPWPILINVKIVTNDNRVTITGSNSDTTFEMDVPAEVETEGAVCISFAMLSKFVTAAKSTQVTIDADEKSAKISSGRNRITLMCSDVADYPNYKITEGETVAVDVKTFCAALKYCAAAASTEESRYHLCGVSFDEADAELNMWGTNGHIASRAVLSDMPSIGGGGTLPNDAVQTVLSIASKADEMAINISERGWSAVVRGTRVWGKVIDGKFPDMRQMMGRYKDWTDVATIELDRIQTGLAVGSVGSGVTSDKSNKIILKSLGSDAIIFRGGDPSVGVGEAGRAEIDANVLGEFAVGINARYLTAALTGVDADSKILIRSATDGIQIEPSQSNALSKLTSLVMPMRVSDQELSDV